MSDANRDPLDYLVVARAGDLRIRHKHRSDFPDDYRWRKDPELARYDGRPVTAATYEEFVRSVEHEPRYAAPNHESFSIVDEDARHVGNVMYYNVSADREQAELGVLIAEPALWGHGVGRQVMVAFVRYLWESRPFRTLVLHTLEWNERAIRSFRAAGFDDAARVFRDNEWFLRMEARREWWLLWDAEGRFTLAAATPATN